jgi:hypothetical protein
MLLLLDIVVYASVHIVRSLLIAVAIGISMNALTHSSRWLAIAFFLFRSQVWRSMASHPMHEN